MDVRKLCASRRATINYFVINILNVLMRSAYLRNDVIVDMRGRNGKKSKSPSLNSQGKRIV